MPSNNEDMPELLGDPWMASDASQPRDTHAATNRSANAEKGGIPGRRRGDNGLGDPEGQAKVLRDLPIEETLQRQQQLQGEQQKRFEQEMMDLAGADGGWVLPRGLRFPAIWAMIVVASILGLAIVSQVVLVAANIARLPAYGKWLAGGGVVLFGGVLAFVLIRVFWMAIRLSCSPRLNIKALSLLQERQRLQSFVAKHQTVAKGMLRQYLAAFALDDAATRALKEAGISDEEVEALRRTRAQLLDTNRPMSASEWIVDFTAGFQKTLDEAASRRVLQYSKRVAAGTAMAPVAFVDQMIVLYCCSAMVKDLLVIYQLRPAFGQTAVILAQSIVHTYLSGLFEDAAETAADSAADWMGDGVGALGGMVGKAVCAKGAEAALNGILLWRLGRKVTQLLQPCRIA